MRCSSSMETLKFFWRSFFILVITFAVIQACGANRDGNSSPPVVSCNTSGRLPCALVKMEPPVGAASLSLKDPNGVTTAMEWTQGQNIAANGCSQTDPNGPSLYLTQPGKYGLSINANGYQPAEIEFTTRNGECGSAPCVQTCLQTDPASLEVALTAIP